MVGEHDRYDQQTLGERPGPRQGHQPLVDILDHVDHETEIDDIGRFERLVRRKIRIPPGGGEPVFAQAAHVVAAPAAIVEQPIAAIQKAMPRERLHRRGETVADHRGTVPRRLPIQRAAESDDVRRQGPALPRLGRGQAPLGRLALDTLEIADRDQRVPLDPIPGIRDQRLPLTPITDAFRVVEQPDRFGLLGQGDIVDTAWMIARQQ